MLLSTEGLLTVLVSAVAFKEHVGRRVWVGAGLMLGASVLLLREPGDSLGLSLHAAEIIGACAFWALDNNLTRPLSGLNPATIAMVKGLVAGSVNRVTLSERHDHAHSHAALAHSHRHMHDEHHHHDHNPAADPKPHAHLHWHQHEPLTHDHAHLPDLHHRHGHTH